MLYSLKEGRMVFLWEEASVIQKMSHILKIVNRRLLGDIQFNTYKEYYEWISGIYKKRPEKPEQLKKLISEMTEN